MRIRVLGSAAGGGFPQWNCGCPNCRAVRAGDPRVQSRTQDSLAVEGSAGRWHLVNASPDIGRQVETNPVLHPRTSRDSPIASIVLSNGDLDHVLGLFSLRESWPLVVYATSAVRRGLDGRNVVLRTLERFPGQLVWLELKLFEPIAVDEGLTVEARPAPGKLPVHLSGCAEPSAEDNVALWWRETHSGARAVYMGATSRALDLDDELEGVDCVFFDGTFWSSDELGTLGLSQARAEDMAHVPIGGEGGSLRALAHVRARKIYTHINNSNPILVAGSAERCAVEAAGVEVAFDGMEVRL